MPLNPYEFDAYLPSREEIIEKCRQIREEGYTDHRGKRHKPWGSWEEKNRKSGPIHQKHSDS